MSKSTKVLLLIMILMPSILFASTDYTIELVFPLSKPLGYAQMQSLCSTLYNSVSSRATYNLNANYGLPFQCSLDTSDTETAEYGTLTVDIYAMY